MIRTLEEINSKYSALLGAEYTLVTGEGDPRASLMLVGEAPGRPQSGIQRRASGLRTDGGLFPALLYGQGGFFS